MSASASGCGRAPLYGSVAALLRLYRSGELSPVEVARDLLDRIDAHESALHCFVTLTPEVALERARIAEAEAVTDDRERLRRTSEIRKLTLPGEMGERFQVMGFTRDVDLSAAFAFGDLSRRL